jgi:bile acid:Na+ symporter, BASS family
VVRALIAIVIPAMNFLLLAAVGLDLTSRDFARVRQQWTLVVFGVVAPLLILPPLALGLTRLFQASPEITGSVLLIAACPIGGISNAYSYLAKASTALSVTLTGLSCLAATVTVPLVSKGFELILEQPLGFYAPLPILVPQLVLMLALPVAVGMWVRRHAPDLAERHRATLGRVAFIGTGIVLLLIIAEAPHAFVNGLSTTVPLAVVFVVSSIMAGWMSAAVATDDSRDRFTIAAEFGARNVAVAMAIAVALLGRLEFARFAVTYSLTEIPLMLAAVALFRRRQTLSDARRATPLAGV